MKRSEAIVKLTDDLMCYYDSKDEAEFMAKSFLHSVESLGMLPPNMVAGGFENGLIINEWESENEA